MESVVKFEVPSTALIVGPSGSGKSTFVFEMLKQANGLFTAPPKAIYYSYSVNQPLFDLMKKQITMEFISDLPTKEMLDLWHLQEPGHKLLIIDDQMRTGGKNELLVDIYCQYSHHMNFTCWFICQNLFNASKQFRCMSLNTHYFILFKNQRDQNQVALLARQVFGSEKFFLDAYRKATDKPYGYILLDLSPHSISEYKVRTNILPNQRMSVFQSNNAK